MELHGLAPWIGSGASSQPFGFNVVFTSWVWRAELIVNNLTCWDPVTGEPRSGIARLGGLNMVVVSARDLYNTGTCALVRAQGPSWIANDFNSVAGLPCIAGDLLTFAAYVDAQASDLRPTLESNFSNLDWTDPIAAAITIIDGTKDASDESLRYWSYLRYILNPNLPTDDGPAELYQGNPAIPGSYSANMTRVNEVLACRGDLSNPIWQAELAYRFIVFQQGVNTLAENGL